jgi:hypothetical protein
MTPLLHVGQSEYLGLVRVVGVIARHPDFPGKRDAVGECVDDIEERSREGRLTPAQRAELLGILLDDRSRR